MARALYFAIFVASFLAALPALAKDGDHSLRVVAEPEVVELGARFRYTVEASTRSSAGIDLVDTPEFPASFRVLGNQSFPQFININGRVERRLTLAFVIEATETGKFTIPAPRVRFGNEYLEGQPVTFTIVAQGKAPAQPAQRSEQYYIETDIRPAGRKAYIGEQLTLAYKLLVDARHMSVEAGPPDEPSLDDFWIEPIARDARGLRQTTTVNGRLMRQTSLTSYALFPLKAGPVTIDPISVELHFGSFFRRGKSVKVAADPIEIEIMPLPPNAPESFYEGNVGDWEFSVRTDTARTRVGRPISLDLSATGAGQVNRIRLPEVPDLPSFRKSEPQEEVKKDFRGTTVYGSKRLSYSLMPLEEGEFEIPPLTFSWFDPETGEYKTKTTRPVKVSVSPGELPPAPVAPADLTQRQSSSSEDLVQRLQADLPDIRRSMDSNTPSPFHLSWLYRVLLALGILGVFGLLSEAPVRRLVARRKPRAERDAFVRDALELLESETLDHERLSQALKIYFRDAVGLAPGAVSVSRLARALAEIGVDADPAPFIEALKLRDTARFAPSTSESREAMRKHAHACAAAIRALEKSHAPRKGAATRAAIVLLATSFAFAASAPRTASAEPDALKAYDESRFSAAADVWTLQASETDAPDILYNLGLASAKASRFAEARLALERAALRAPLDADIEAARASVQRIIRLKTIEGSQMGKTLEGTEALFWWRTARTIPAELLPITVLILTWLSAACLILRRRRTAEHRSALNSLAAAALGLTILAGSAWATRDAILSHVRPGVLLVDDGEFREGPSEHAGVQARVPNATAGTIFRVRDLRDGWAKVELNDERTGWISANDIGFIE